MTTTAELLKEAETEAAWQYDSASGSRRVCAMIRALMAAVQRLEGERGQLRKALAYTIPFREFSDEWHDSNNRDIVEFRQLRSEALGTASSPQPVLLTTFLEVQPSEPATLKVGDSGRLINNWTIGKFVYASGPPCAAVRSIVSWVMARSHSALSDCAAFLAAISFRLSRKGSEDARAALILEATDGASSVRLSTMECERRSETKSVNSILSCEPMLNTRPSPRRSSATNHRNPAECHDTVTGKDQSL